MSDHGLETENLTRRFGRVTALDGVSLAIPRGQVLGLLGPNGAGKTTLIRILATLLRPDGGRARVAGFDVARQPGQVRRRIALSGQHTSVDEELTGLANLVMIGRLLDLPRRQALRRAADLLARFGLEDAADRPVAKIRRRGSMRASIRSISLPGKRGLTIAGQAPILWAARSSTGTLMLFSPTMGSRSPARMPASRTSAAARSSDD